MGGGLQRAFGAAKGHAFAMKMAGGKEACIRCGWAVERCAKSKARCNPSDATVDGLSTCAGCGQPIRDGSTYRSNGPLRFHPRCKTEHWCQKHMVVLPCPTCEPKNGKGSGGV